MKRFTKKELRRLRNEIPVRWVIETLLQIPHKEIEGVYRFLSPCCHEFTTSLNPNANLARCHRCEKNFNPIDMLMAERALSFVESVKMLLQKEPLVRAAPPCQQAVSKGGSLERAEIARWLSCHLKHPCSAD